jgi:sarcosine oxidase
MPRRGAQRPTETIEDFARSVRACAGRIAAGGGHGTYALHDPTYGLKLGKHKSGSPLDPGDQPGPQAELVEQMREAVARYFPTADSNPVDVQTCLYTNTDDERFVLERHGRIVVGSACSGHGFKFAPVVGERLADLSEAKV